MNQHVSAAQSPSGMPADRRMSERVFVFIGMAIVLGGLWMLYMGDAPYHPEGGTAENHIQIYTDS